MPEKNNPPRTVRNCRVIKYRIDHVDRFEVKIYSARLWRSWGTPWNISKETHRPFFDKIAAMRGAESMASDVGVKLVWVN